MSKLAELSRWIPGKAVRPLNPSACRLICFPFAGAGASTFRTWQDELPLNIELLPVQLPGRESRWSEPPFLDLSHLAETLRDVFLPVFSEPYALFGHSMGGLIAFELARELRRRNLPLPRQLFISGARAPHIPDRELRLHHLPDNLFWNAIQRDYGAARDPALLNPELAPILLPILRADFRMCETYAPRYEEPFSFPVTVYGGRSDRRVTYSDLIAWSAYTHRAFRLHLLAGEHFFLTTDRRRFLKTLSGDLTGLAGREKVNKCATD